MNKLSNFVVGTVCGVFLGGMAALLYAPYSGRDWSAEAKARWHDALADAQAEMEKSQQTLQARYEQLTK